MFERDRCLMLNADVKWYLLAVTVNRRVCRYGRIHFGESTPKIRIASIHYFESDLQMRYSWAADVKGILRHAMYSVFKTPLSQSKRHVDDCSTGCRVTLRYFIRLRDYLQPVFNVCREIFEISLATNSAYL